MNTHKQVLITKEHIDTYVHMYIKTHDSESRGQKEAGRTRRTTRSTAVKFVDALNKPPLKLSLSYLGLS